MKTISIRSILDDVVRFIPQDSFNEAEILEDCAKAMDRIGYVLQYQPDIEFVKITNHKGCLPKGYIEIRQVGAKVFNGFSDLDLDVINQYTHLDKPEYEGSHLADSILLSSWYQKDFRPLRLSTNTFALSVHCQDCRNTCNTCEHEYTVTPDGSITTSFKEGFVCISYTRYPVDCNGDFLIPDNENYKEALKNFVLMRKWEISMNMKEEGAANLYKNYQSLFALHKAKAYAEMRTNVASMENVANIATRLLPKYNGFNRFFGNLNSQEKLIN